MHGRQEVMPPISSVWPIAPGTNATQAKVDALTTTRFVVIDGVLASEHLPPTPPLSTNPPMDRVDWNLFASKTPTICTSKAIGFWRGKKDNTIYM